MTSVQDLTSDLIPRLASIQTEYALLKEICYNHIKMLLLDFEYDAIMSILTQTNVELNDTILGCLIECGHLPILQYLHSHTYPIFKPFIPKVTLENISWLCEHFDPLLSLSASMIQCNVEVSARLISISDFQQFSIMLRDILPKDLKMEDLPSPSKFVEIIELLINAHLIDQKELWIPQIFRLLDLDFVGGLIKKADESFVVMISAIEARRYDVLERFLNPIVEDNMHPNYLSIAAYRTNDLRILKIFHEKGASFASRNRAIVSDEVRAWLEETYPV